MVSPRKIVRPGIEASGDFDHIVRRQRVGEPAIGQRMGRAEAFGHIVERHHVPPALALKFFHDRRDGSGDNADGQQRLGFEPVRHLVRRQQLDPLPGIAAADLVRAGVDDQHRLHASIAQEIQRHPAEGARAVDCQRTSRGEGRSAAGLLGQLPKKQAGLRAVGKPVKPA